MYIIGNLKVLEIGPLKFRKDELEVTFSFYKTFQAEKVTFMKDDLFSWQCLVKVL